MSVGKRHTKILNNSQFTIHNSQFTIIFLWRTQNNSQLRVFCEKLFSSSRLGIVQTSLPSALAPQRRFTIWRDCFFVFEGLAIHKDSAKWKEWPCKFTYKRSLFSFCVIVADNQTLAIKRNKTLRQIKPATKSYCQTPRNEVSVERFWAPFFEKVQRK